MAMGVCLRVLRDEHLAEDALPATFLVLALKAGSICNRGSVASWLYGVALRLAHKVKADAHRSRQPIDRETPGRPSDHAKRHEVQELLEEELQRLPDKYRLPLVLCYFEGQTQEEAAAQLGWTPGRLKGLLDRGQERLRSRLIRRGLALSVPSLAALLGETAWAGMAISPRLAMPVVQAAMKLVSGRTLAECGVSASVVTLVKGVWVMSTKKALLISRWRFRSLVSAPVFGQGPARCRLRLSPGKSLGAVQDRPVPAPVRNEQDHALAIAQAIEAFHGQEPQNVEDNQEPFNPEEHLIDRLIEAVKDGSLSREQRVKACVALGKREPRRNVRSRTLPSFLRKSLLSTGERQLELTGDLRLLFNHWHRHLPTGCRLPRVRGPPGFPPLDMVLRRVVVHRAIPRWDTALAWGPLWVKWP